MEKLSIEEKAKAYDEAVEKLRDFYRDYDTVSCLIDVKEELANLFPALKESEDERIRKWIINEIKIKHHNLDEDNVDFVDKAIAWLENIPYTIDHEKREGFHLGYKAGLEKQDEQKPADKVEPKFHEGDWVLNNVCLPVQIALIKDGMYIFTDGDALSVSFIDETYHLWTIDDAKDGDVLATSAGAFIYNGNNGGGGCPGCYCGIDTLGNFKTGVEHHWTGKRVFPATKSQRDTLFAKMKEAGYEWDAEKKELKKIEQKPWSEEDEKILKDILVDVRFEGYNNDMLANSYKKINWLKSLRPQNRWKPTKEQMDALLFVVQHYTPKVTDKLAWDSIKILELMYYEIKQ